MRERCREQSSLEGETLWYGGVWNGVSQLAEVEGKMDADQFVSILEEHLLPSLEESGIPEEQVIFQQDNDPKHKSKKAKNWMETTISLFLTGLHSLQT